jgi:hypothetical protein
LEVVEVAAKGALEEPIAFGGIACGARAVEFEIERTSGKDGHRAEKLRVFESQPGRAIATHAEALEQTAFTCRDGAEVRVDVGDEFLDHDGLHGNRAVLRIAPHAGGESVGKDDEHRRDFAFPDGFVEEGRERGDAFKPPPVPCSQYSTGNRRAVSVSYDSGV